MIRMSFHVLHPLLPCAWVSEWVEAVVHRSVSLVHSSTGMLTVGMHACKCSSSARCTLRFRRSFGVVRRCVSIPRHAIIGCILKDETGSELLKWIRIHHWSLCRWQHFVLIEVQLVVLELSGLLNNVLDSIFTPLDWQLGAMPSTEQSLHHIGRAPSASACAPPPCPAIVLDRPQSVSSTLHSPSSIPPRMPPR